MDIIDNSEQELYINYKPQFNNLYGVEIEEITPSEFKKFGEVSNVVKYHATKVSFGSDSLELTRNNVSKMFQVKDNAYGWTNDLTITWRESEYWPIKQYHEVWLAQFYDKSKGVYRSTSSSHPITDYYRTFKIYFPYNITDINYLSNSKSINTSDRKILGIEFKGVIPQGTGNIDVNWNTKGDIVTHQIKYYVHSWEWINSKF